MYKRKKYIIKINIIIYMFFIFIVLFNISSYADNIKNSFIILDCSSSMAESAGSSNTSKFEIIRNTLNNFLNSNKNSNIGLIVFGAYKNNDCDDYKLLFSPGTPIEKIKDSLNSLIPTGKTPVANTLQFVKSLSTKYDVNSVMLLTDGYDNCNPDLLPKIINEYKKDNIALKIYGIGNDNNRDNLYNKLSNTAKVNYEVIKNTKQLNNNLETLKPVQKPKEKNTPVKKIVIPEKPKHKFENETLIIPKKIKINDNKKIKQPTDNKIKNKTNTKTTTKKIDNKSTNKPINKTEIINNSADYKNEPVLIPPTFNIKDEDLPKYPYIARKFGLEGGVKLKILVSDKGKVISVKIYKSSGHEILDNSAVDAAKNWVFKPARKYGIAKYAYIYKTIYFKLDDDLIKIK